MLLASVNLNKRLGGAGARARLVAWLHRHRVDVLVAQEPWRSAGGPAPELAGYRSVGGDGDLFCWIAENLVVPPVFRPRSFVQRLELGWLVVYNTYLECRSVLARGRQLAELARLLTAEENRPAFACGDFNLAPRAVDGLHNGRHSCFNSETDRAPFAELLFALGLVDSTATDPPQYTIERDRPGGHTRFRCDLALVPDYLRPATTVRYDHSTRSGEVAFTDHSALLIDAPVTLDTRADDHAGTLFSLLPESVGPPGAPRVECQPHKTAKGRIRPSPYARTVVDVLAPKLGTATVLDHGCGRGADLALYRSVGLDADGWDPHPGFGHTEEPRRRYDLVTNVFVLNVLADPWQRLRALRHAAGFLRPGGQLFVVTRSPADVEPRAAAANWPTHHDGYWSNQARGTFQRGISSDEIVALGRRVGLVPSADRGLLADQPAAGQALLVNR